MFAKDSVFLIRDEKLNRRKSADKTRDSRRISILDTSTQKENSIVKKALHFSNQSKAATKSTSARSSERQFSNKNVIKQRSLLLRSFLSSLHKDSGSKGINFHKR